MNESELDPLKHNVTTHNEEQIESLTRNNINNEKKHQINIKEIEVLLTFFKKMYGNLEIKYE